MNKSFFIQKRTLQSVLLGTFGNLEAKSFCQAQILNCNTSTYVSKGHERRFATLAQALSGKKVTRRFPVGALCTKVQVENTDGNAPSKEVTDSKNGRKKDFNFDALGTWDNRIDLPIMMEASIKQGAPVPLIVPSDVGCSSIIGKRTYQEDRYVVTSLPDSVLCAAVFDGHGGSECSEFCQQNLESILTQQLSQHKDLEAVLHHSFLTLHSQYVKWTEEHSAGLKAGTTANVCLLRNGVELAVGHVGDSRAILCRMGSARELTRDHCPSNKSEKVRILQSGGRVSVDNIGRHMVNETLNMSRSIGDIPLKSFGVTALPDTRTLRVKHGKDAFLLLTTDGINFVLRNEEACDIVNQAPDPYRAAQLLTEQALSMSSEDNLTALVIPFGSWGKYTKSASMFFSFGIGRDMSKSSRFG